MKRGIIALTLIPGFALAQTPPIKPQTPDVKVPPQIELPGPTHPEASGKALSAAEAVAIALRNQPDLVIAQADLRAAQGRTQQARSGLYPQLGFSGRFSEIEQIRGASGGGFASPIRFSTTLTLSQLLFDFERTRDAVRQQSALEKASRQAITRSRQDITLAVKRAFYNYYQNVRLIGVAEANVVNRQRQLDLANALVNSGLGPPGDLVRAKTNLADAVIALSNARNAAANSRVLLADLMGIDPRTPISPAESIEPDSAVDITGLVRTALDQRPEIKEAQERWAAARYGVSVANKTNVPRVDLTADHTGRGADDPLQTQTATFGINVRWTFGDGGLTAGRKKEARANEDIARARLLDTSQLVISEVSQAYLDLRHSGERVETAQVQVANARELVRISEGRYRGEIGQFLEVTDAQNSLVAAERNLLQAESDVQRARAALARAIGG